MSATDLAGFRRRQLGGAVAGLVVFAATAVEARRREVSEAEEALFRTANELPDEAHGPVWVLMQSGSLAGALGLAGVALAVRRPATAAGMAVGGTSMWALAKLVKNGIGRGRPVAHLDEVRIRGGAQSGLGFPSGHAAVAATLATIVAPLLPRPARVAAAMGAVGTAVARTYVGAHLPADVIGGAGLGIAVGCLTNVALGDRGRDRRPLSASRSPSPAPAGSAG